MKATAFLTVIVTALALLTSSCSKDSTTGPSKTEPTISVSKSEIKLSGNPYVDRIEILNAGGGTLEWSIQEKPDWLEIDILEGAVTNDTAVVRLHANFAGLDYGSYTGTIRISSNGGDIVINVEFENKPPQLTIENLVINMDRHYNRSELVIMNEGGGELIWHIAHAPDWVRFEIESDTIRSYSQYVPFAINFRSMDYGYYEEKIIVESNGGSAEIALFFTYEREIEVYPGVGAAYIQLGQTYTMVQNQWGTPDKNWYDRPEHTVFIHHFTYDDIGLHFAVKTNSPILYGSGKVGYIELFPPYDGMTEGLIGIGSTTDELIAAHGQPTSKSGNQWYYDEGITFIIKNNKVNRMIIKDDNF